MQYLRGTIDICLVYGTNGSTSGLVGYADSNNGGDLIKRNSLTYYIFILYGCAISWKVILLPTVTLSTIEVVCMSMIEGVKEGIGCTVLLILWVWMTYHLM
jgi:hypothetical protein